MAERPEMLLWLSDRRGAYIPRDFATSFADRTKSVPSVSAADWTILETGPENELYWDVWTDILDTAIVTDEHGNRYTVYQDGDCWLIPVGMVWSDTGDFYQWPENEGESNEESV